MRGTNVLENRGVRGELEGNEREVRGTNVLEDNFEDIVLNLN